MPSHSLSLCTQKGSIADPMVWPKLYLSGEAMILSALNVIYSKRLPKSTQRDRLHSDLCFLASLYLTPGPTTHTLSKWNTHKTQLYGSTKSRTHARTHNASTGVALCYVHNWGYFISCCVGFDPRLKLAGSSVDVELCSDH